MSRMTPRAQLAVWHARQAENARLRAENWSRSVAKLRALEPPAHVAADRDERCRALALAEAAFHQAAADLLEGYRGR
jgi:hypothetical protein